MNINKQKTDILFSLVPVQSDFSGYATGSIVGCNNCYTVWMFPGSGWHRRTSPMGAGHIFL